MRVLRVLLETSLLLLGLVPIVLEASWAGEPGLFREENAESFGDERLFGILENALKSNPNIAAAAEKVVQAREDVRSAISAMGPTVGVGASARHEPDRNVYNASLNLVQTLYAGGSLRANRRAAELVLLVADLGETDRLVERPLPRFSVGQEHVLTHPAEGGEDPVDERRRDSATLEGGMDENVLQVGDGGLVGDDARQTDQFPARPRGDHDRRVLQPADQRIQVFGVGGPSHGVV